MPTVPVTDKTFSVEVLESDKPVLVDFWAEWCGPCRQVGPILEQIADEYSTKIKIVKLNVDHNPLTSSYYGITSIPNMSLFINGEIIKSIIGAQPKQALLQQLNEQLK